jgi:shikimate kinase
VIEHSNSPPSGDQEALRPAWRLERTVALVGLMGVGKSTVGRRLAHQVGATFVDADEEIVVAAGRPIADIFADRGEDEFRAGERRVIARILQGPPAVLATGGGAFMNPLTRVLLRQRAVSVWLRADLDLLMARVSRRDDRPLLRVDDPRAVMAGLMETRYPVYAQADLVVDSRNGPHQHTVDALIDALAAHGVLRSEPSTLNSEEDLHG